MFRSILWSPVMLRSKPTARNLILILLVGFQVAQAEETSRGDSDHKTELIRGRVVWLADGLKSEFGISTVPEAAERSLAVLTDQRQLLPIVENLRGRAFRKDERLRGKELEILARRYARQPLIQVLRIYEVDGEKRHEIDYWCDICAIVMFEKGPCSCCQDDNRLRRRLVEPGDIEAQLQQ